jgi:hypothetical protein
MSCNLYFDVSLDGGAYSNVAHLTSAGELVFGATSTGTLEGQEADGAAAVAIAIDTSVAYATAGAKLLSVRNNGAEKLYVDKDGYTFAPGVRISAAAGAGVASHLTLTNSIVAADDTQAVLGKYHVNGSAGVFHGWVKMYDGATAIYVPSWKYA